MGKVIVYTRAGGGTSIMRPNPRMRIMPESEAQFAARVAMHGFAPDAPNVQRPGESIGQVRARVAAEIGIGDRAAAVPLLLRALGESEDAFVERIRKKDVPPDATNVRVVDESEVPADRGRRDRLKPDLTFA